MKELLDGNKTYIGIVVFGLYNLAVHFSPGLANIVSADVMNTMIFAWTGWSFRDAIKKSEK